MGRGNPLPSLLGNVYFSAYISGCGAVTEVIELSDTWKAKTVIGYAAIPYESIFIEKHSGEITCKNSPSIRARPAQ